MIREFVERVRDADPVELPEVLFGAVVDGLRVCRTGSEQIALLLGVMDAARGVSEDVSDGDLAQLIPIAQNVALHELVCSQGGV